MPQTVLTIGERRQVYAVLDGVLYDIETDKPLLSIEDLIPPEWLADTERLRIALTIEVERLPAPSRDSIQP